MHTKASNLATLLGTASFMTLAGALQSHAQQIAQTQTPRVASSEVPEQVLVTGSLIRGTVTVGTPVTSLGSMDFTQAGALTVSDLLRTIPQFNVQPGPVGTQVANVERGTRVNLRQLDTGTAPRSLLMIDGLRYPPQGNGTCQLDPSIIPSVAIARVDIFLDGASATYGSDAIGGVINLILKRRVDGAITEFGYTTGAGGNQQYMASQLWGRSWDGGNVTLGYEWRDVAPTNGNFSSKFTFDHSPWGLDNRNPLGSSIPGTISTGAPASADATNYPANIGNNCTNCFAIPKGAGANFNPLGGGIGPTAPFGASTLNWTSFNIASNRGSNGTRNEFNPYEITPYSSALQYNGAFATIDQRLTRNISFYGEAFYGMRRANYIFNDTNQQLSVAVPTWNPYYPTGGAPNNLRVNYHLGIETPTTIGAWARGMRYLGGLNIDLPRNWAAQVYYGLTQDNESNRFFGSANRAQVSAALGWTLPVTVAAGTTPAVATWTKPANVPYLNLFCDPTAFQCNADATLRYIEGFRQTNEYFIVNEKGIKADGPLFDLPGGQVKAALGATYSSYHQLFQQTQTGQNNPTLVFQSDANARQVWAVFGQVNVPVIGESNALPGVRRLELEGSWRHDQYSDVGGTSNPRLGFNWGISDDLGLTVRGSWGQSFRAPTFGENSAANVFTAGFGLPSNVIATPAQFQILVSCDAATGRPPADSGAEKLFKAGFACNSEPAGEATGGGARAVAQTGLRTYANTTEFGIEPETSVNWAVGFDLAPAAFLPGLDIQATWYSIKISNVLRNFGSTTTASFASPGLGFAWLVPSDLRDPATGAQLCPGMDSAPASCAPFQDLVAAQLTLPSNTIRPEARTLIYWISDGGLMNKGWQRNTGIDFSASYNWEAGDLGAWNTGIIGTYYLGQESVVVPGAAGPLGEVVDPLYHTTVSAGRGLVMAGVEARPRLKYRARLGWAKGPWSVTGFMDYEAHFFHTQTSPPNVNANCLTAGGTVGGGTFPCAIGNYTNIVPSYYSFDLSLGYETGDSPVNDYLKHIGIQLIVQNITDRVSPYEYRIASGGGNPCACDVLKSLYGRRYQLRVLKTW